ncbi:hypothetical protein EVAR_14880_1 [Eumeta japonica]|uniref:Uncharacterized protein n=1 Tax=Eumeta variegata TaxID=151549 RepID=A0A4C1V3R1_EUMVA|nr:hypothetical protein EVAR_14880_1 [Eumeta japonica]
MCCQGMTATEGAYPREGVSHCRWGIVRTCQRTRGSGTKATRRASWSLVRRESEMIQWDVPRRRRSKSVKKPQWNFALKLATTTNDPMKLSTAAFA